MGRKQKRLEALRNSQVGWRYDDLARILGDFGFTCETRKGSHRVFKHPSGGRVGLVDAGSGTLLPAYARAVLEQIEALATETDDDSE